MSLIVNSVHIEQHFFARTLKKVVFIRLSLSPEPVNPRGPNPTLYKTISLKNQLTTTRISSSSEYLQKYGRVRINNDHQGQGIHHQHSSDDVGQFVGH